MAPNGTTAHSAVPERLSTAREVCELLGISKQTLYRLVHRGELTPTRIGERGTRFEAADVADLIERGKAVKTS